MMITIYMCNQIGTSEIREQFHARFVQILPISRAFFGQKESEIILLFYKYTIWLPLNPRTYTQSHTPTVVQGGWWGGGVWSVEPLPWVFDMLKYTSISKKLCFHRKGFDLLDKINYISWVVSLLRTCDVTKHGSHLGRHLGFYQELEIRLKPRELVIFWAWHVK